MAHNGPVDIAYERFGADDGEPMLLVMGLGMQMIFWPDDFCAALAARGFAVARFDNRDVGRSSHFTHLGVPRLGRMLSRPLAAAPYRLDDMADDGVAVLDALGWTSAHVVGVSLGGMIAQTIAIRHPGRVRSLASMMSTPSPRIGRPRLDALAVLASRPASSRDHAERRSVRVFRVIGTRRYPRDETWLRETARKAYDRGQDPLGARRQLAAILASGDRRPGLAGVRVPTLVIHGDADPLVRLAGGRATAASVPGARLVIFPGMGHDLPRALWPAIVDHIQANTRLAET